MLSQPIAKQLEAHLDEVSFVYRSLPHALARVEVITPTKGWRSFFHRQADILRAHQSELRGIVAAWGRRLRPCACEEVTEKLNEVRYALAARPGTPLLERTVHKVLSELRAMVIKDLEDAERIAKKLEELDLSAQLHNLLKSEQELARAQEEPFRK
ncbi:MAG: hypothetical protein ABI599_11450 [Flavobacteriales bacterium]